MAVLLPCYTLLLHGPGKIAASRPTADSAACNSAPMFILCENLHCILDLNSMLISVIIQQTLAEMLGWGWDPSSNVVLLLAFNLRSQSSHRPTLTHSGTRFYSAP